MPPTRLPRDATSNEDVGSSSATNNRSTRRRAEPPSQRGGREGAGRDTGAAPSSRRRQTTRMWEAVLWQSEHMHEAPAIIVACAVLDHPGQDPNRYASSIWPGIQNLLLAARATGLGAVPTTYALRFRDELHEVLGLPPTTSPRKRSSPSAFPSATSARSPVARSTRSPRSTAGPPRPHPRSPRAECLPPAPCHPSVSRHPGRAANTRLANVGRKHCRIRWRGRRRRGGPHR